MIGYLIQTTLNKGNTYFASVAQLPVSVNINGQVYTGTVDVPTVRIPELSPNVLPYDPADTIPLYDSSENKTVKTPISTFRDYIITGGNTAGETPILQGADLQIEITEGMIGRQVSVPALQGKTYTLDRRGTGQLATSEFLNLPSGGFELLDPAPPAALGEIFFAHVYELAVSTDPTSTATSGFLTGIANVTDSIALNTVHYKKLIHVAGGSNKVTVTLPDISEAYASNLVVPIETNISNTNQTRIAAKSGQSIYFGNTSQTEIYLGISESVWLMAGSDGWYVMKASEGLLNVCQPFFDYVQRLNTVVAKGQIANRADYPRLIKMLTNNPNMWVDEALWQTSEAIPDAMTGTQDTYYPYKGLFSKGDGSTTFRFPDLQDVAFAGLNNIGGADPFRTANNPGNIQRDMLRRHDHGYNTRGSQAPQSGSSTQVWIGDATARTTAAGEYKNRMINAGFLPLVRI